MIIENGTIETKAKTVGKIDPKTGYPSKPSDVSWSDPIPCQYSANKYNKLGRVSGEHFIRAEYSVLIEEQPFDAEQIRLKDLNGNVVGEFSVISVEPLTAVCEIRILV
ncbi:hypothetical protein K0E99_17605 [Bacteroides fragilis]|jgi:hypothetical protein|uniref:hypothetical protein n=1 Tax=Bacteroides TaxID=816 RepID=UPI0022AA3C37|nr:hypothetical protein [Bacteroides fragilis]MCE8584881.1 hypothetical protein [Bacteroides fragilis]MCE8606023.1 hypothetical protein [Bacteroides fragilis]MCE8609981.1 hypothetical protein [Bacteroides fragilis]MCE8666077.1 hypothetical protein [Bacteroides fragilis]MCE8669223.1 hypothetical protein [Bacteroides fragilis]